MSNLFGGSPSGTTTVNNQSDPWAGAIPSLNHLFHYSRDQYDRTRGDPNAAIAGPSAETTGAENLLAARAQAGSGVNRAAQHSATQTLGGAYLDPATNPAWDTMSSRITDAYRRGTAAPLDAQFGGGGNAFMDNSAYQEMRGQNERALGDSLGSLAGSLYNEERDRMVQQSALAPHLANQDFVDINALGQVGAARDNLQQRRLDSPWDQLTRYQRLVSGQPGGGGSTQAPYFSNTAGNLMGMGLMGMSIYDMMNS